MRLRLSSMLFAAAVTCTVALSSPAHAVGKDEASPDGKGIVGGALLGAEAVMLVEAAVGVRPAWAYIVGGVAGGAAGGVGGYLLEQDADSARVPMLLLAGGVVLAIPTTVAVLSRTAYKPPPDYVQDRAPVDEPVADPPAPSPATSPAPPSSVPPTGMRERGPAKRAARVAKAKFSRAQLSAPRLSVPPSLLGYESGMLSLSVPAVEVRSLYSRRELLQTGQQQQTEVRIPVFNYVF